MKNFQNLCIISNDKFYKRKYTNHNDLDSIVEAFDRKYKIHIIGRYTKTKFKFLTIKRKIKFLDFFSIKTLKYIKSLYRQLVIVLWLAYGNSGSYSFISGLP